MKTITQLALTGLVTAMLATGSAFAGDSEWRTIDNHHGALTYLPGTTQKQTTVAFYNGRSGKGIGRVNGEVKRDQGTFRQVTTPHGTVTYYVSAE